MRGRQFDEFGYTARPQHQRQIGIIKRLEQHHLVTRCDQRHQSTGQSLGGTRGHHHLALPIQRQTLPVLIMAGDGLAQFGQAHHRRILVPAIDHRIGGLLTHIERARIIGETLTEIDGLRFTRPRRHGFEDRGRQTGKNGVHLLVHGWISCKFGRLVASFPTGSAVLAKEESARRSTPHIKVSCTTHGSRIETGRNIVIVTQFCAVQNMSES